MPGKIATETLTGQYYADFLGEPDEFDTDNGATLRWKFLAYTDAGEVEVSDLSSDKWSAKAKAVLWSEAILGRILDDGENFEWSDIKGQRVLLTLSENAAGYQRIDSIVKVPAEGQVPVAAPPAAPAAAVATSGPAAGIPQAAPAPVAPVAPADAEANVQAALGGAPPPPPPAAKAPGADFVPPDEAPF